MSNPVNSPDQIFNMAGEVLSNFPSIVLATVFGSAASGRLRADSDVDVAVASNCPLDFDGMLSIQEALSLRFKREVDLLDLSQAHGLILSQALAKGRIVLCHDRGLLYQLMREIVYYEADFAPLVRRCLRAKAEKFANE